VLHEVQANRSSNALPPFGTCCQVRDALRLPQHDRDLALSLPVQHDPCPAFLLGDAATLLPLRWRGP